MMVRRFAEHTRVPIEQTRNEIERTLERYGATAFAYMRDGGRSAIVFKAEKRHIKISLTVSTGESERERREARQRWRALLLVIKAKLESVASGIETLEQAFYANIVMPDGRTVYEATREQLRVAYDTGQVRPLLPDYSGKGPT